VLRRARKFPVGLARNDLRQLARGLLKLHRTGIRANSGRPRQAGSRGGAANSSGATRGGLRRYQNRYGRPQPSGSVSRFTIASVKETAPARGRWSRALAGPRAAYFFMPSFVIESFFMPSLDMESLVMPSFFIPLFMPVVPLSIEPLFIEPFSMDPLVMPGLVMLSC
jgi:hypothetical protein